MGDRELSTRLDEQTSVQREKRILEDFAKDISAFEQVGVNLKPEADEPSSVLPSVEEAKLPHRGDLEQIQTIAKFAFFCFS